MQQKDDKKRQRLAILGSTGSIGTQTLDIVRSYPDLFEVDMLAAGTNWESLVSQAIEFEPNCVVIADERYYKQLTAALEHLPIKVYTGADAVEQSVASTEVDTVVSAMVGFAGLAPTLAAIRAGKKIALANKETLVVAGELVMSEARRCKAPIVPVDSEHSAVFQCLVGEMGDSVKRLVLTASGGAFRDLSKEALRDVTVQDALKHPCWEMGQKITVDCATMVNKGFEVMEARWLFDIAVERIDVVVHPQSVIHSFVEFNDGAFKAQMGVTDMRLPIQYALTFPYRLPIVGGDSYDPLRGGDLTFSAPDADKYPCLGLAYDVLRGVYGGGGGCVLNAANEVAVAAFLRGGIRFVDIYTVLRNALESLPQREPKTLADYVVLDAEARKWAEENIRETDF